MRHFKHMSFDRLEARICLHSGEHESQIDSAYISTHHGNVPNLAHPQFAEGREIHTITESGDFSVILANHPISDNDIVVVQGHVVYDLPPAADFSVHTL